MILLDPKFHEKERLQGLSHQSPDYFKSIRTRTGVDNKYLLWLRGQSDLSIVNLEEFSARHVNNFWNYKGKNMRALVGAINNEATKLVGIGCLPRSPHVQTIHVYDGGEGVSIFEGKDIIPQGKQKMKKIDKPRDNSSKLPSLLFEYFG